MDDNYDPQREAEEAMKFAIAATGADRHRLIRSPWLGKSWRAPTRWFLAGVPNLTKAEREMIMVATGNLNQCQYCVAAHGAIPRICAKDPLIADQVAVNCRKADITDHQKAMLDFAVRVSTEAQRVSESDFTTPRSHGFTEEDIWDTAAISAFFGLSNRLAYVTSMRPNAEFYSMGRG